MPAPLQPRDRNRYRILGEHGRGGLGLVFRARDKELGRDVALKELLEPSHRTELRFLREALITARLEHPGIVPVHEAGRWPDGTPFYTMKLIAGRPLADVLAESESVGQRLALLPHLIAVADAIAYAHDRNIIHRDLKPSNVIIGGFGETVVIDWGLAKELDDDSAQDAAPAGPYRTVARPDLTSEGGILGTPAYMSPEQARGERADARSDVYALGAILFHICSGGPRRADTSLHDIRRGLRAIPDDLAAIALKSLSEDPAERYPDASSLAADIRLFMSGRLVSAHQYSAAARLRKWAARNRSLVIAAAIASLVIVVVSVASILRIIGERDTANAERQRALRERNSVILAHASKSLMTDPTTAIAWLKKLPDQPGLAHAKRNIAMDADSRGVARRVLSFSPQQVSQVAATSDGNAFIVATRDGLFRRFELPGPTLVASTTASVDCELSSTADGGLVALAQENGNIKLWSREDEEFEVPGHAGVPYATVFSRDGGRLYSAGLDGQVRVVDVAARRSSLLYRHTAPIRSGVALSPTGNRIATAGDDGVVVLFELAPPRALRLDPFPGQGIAAVAVGFLGDGRVVSGHSNGSLVFWTADGRVQETLKVHNGGVDHIRVAPDLSFVLSIGSDRTIARIALPGSSIEVLGAHDSPITNSFLSGGGEDSLFVATFASGWVRVWNLDTGVSRTLKGHEGLVSAATVVLEERRPLVVSAGHDGAVRLWPLPPSPMSREMFVHQGGVLSVVASPDRERFATGGRDGRVVVASPSGVQMELRGDREAAYDLSFSPEGGLLASASLSRRVFVWDLAARRLISSHLIPGDLPGSFIFRGEGRLLLATADAVFEWDYRKDTLRLVRRFGELVDEMRQHRPTGPLLVRTRSGQVHRLESTRWVAASTGAVKLHELGHVLAMPQADRHIVSVIDERQGIEYGPVRLQFELERSLFDARRQVLFAFDRGGRGAAWHLADGTVSYLRSFNGKDKGLAGLPSGAVARVLADGSLERWDFESREIVVVRDRQEGSTGAMVVLPAADAIITAAGDGRVLAWPLDGLERYRPDSRVLSLEALTDLQVDECCEW